MVSNYEDETESAPVPLVSVVCLTYNHERFIGRALEGFVAQKTNFAFECIVADDCSTDGTAQIVREYEQKYPDKIKAIYRARNIGVEDNWFDTLSHARGKYVINNEGDDYFTDPLKLQKQADFLEAHPECAICFHAVEVIYEDNPADGAASRRGVSRRAEVFPSAGMRFNKAMLGLDDLLKQNFIQTNSAMYRWRFNTERVADVFPKGIMPGDWYLHLLHAQTGAIGFIDGVMAVYRRHPGGIWWGSTETETHHLKYGLAEINFYVQVCKNIAPSPDLYRTEIAAPRIGDIFASFEHYGRLNEMARVCEQFPQYVFPLLEHFIKQLRERDQRLSFRLAKAIMSNKVIKLFYKLLRKCLKGSDKPARRALT
jgi:glycosyltransferase involved in cell wall biosynthesis